MIIYTEVFNDCDAIIAPSANGEAPLKESGTGDPILLHFVDLQRFTRLVFTAIGRRH